MLKITSVNLLLAAGIGGIGKLTEITSYHLITRNAVVICGYFLAK